MIGAATREAFATMQASVANVHEGSSGGGGVDEAGGESLRGGARGRVDEGGYAGQRDPHLAENGGRHCFCGRGGLWC